MDETRSDRIDQPSRSGRQGRWGGAFWAWFGVTSGLLFVGISALISINAPDEVSCGRAVALQASNLLMSASAGYKIARRHHRNGVLRRIARRG